MTFRKDFDNNCATLRAILEKTLFIQAFGLMFQNEEKGTNDGDPDCRIVFSNVKKNREVSFLYSQLLDGRGVIVVSVGKKSNDEGFTLEDYLAAKNLVQYVEKIKLSNYQGNFPARVDEFLKGISPIFTQTPLSDIVSGKNWEEIPFDWGGDR